LSVRQHPSLLGDATGRFVQKMLGTSEISGSPKLNEGVPLWRPKARTQPRIGRTIRGIKGTLRLVQLGANRLAFPSPEYRVRRIKPGL